MPRPRPSNEEKVLRSLRLDREHVLRDLESIAGYTDPSWSEFRESCLNSLARIEAAIRTCEQDGLPEGYMEKWGLG